MESSAESKKAGAAAGRHLSPEAALEFCRSAFVRAGMPDQDAAICSSVLVETSLRGVDTHGIALLPMYARNLRKGVYNPRPDMRLTGGGPGAAVLDADNALGVLAEYRAMEHAISLAREAGVAMVGVRRSTHFGAGIYYAMMALAHDMIGLAGSNGPAVMAPHGGTRRAMHNMPLAAAIPTLEAPPIAMDFAMSVVAFRRITAAAEAGEPIPPGWAVDEAGHPTTDAAAGRSGALLPLGYKGYALGILIDVLAGVLTGAGFGDSIAWESQGAPQNTGHFAAAINVAAFMPAEAFKRRADALARRLRAVPPQDPAEPVRVPGERGARVRAERLREGIPVPDALHARLASLASELGLAFPE